jgi:hypothetical protein
LLSEGIGLLQLRHQFIALVDGGRAFFDDVEGGPGIAFVDDDLSLYIFLSDQGASDGIFVVVREIAEKSDIFHELLVLFVFLDDDLFDGLSEGVTVDGPKRAMLTGLNRKGPGRFIEKSDLSEAISDSQCFLDLIVGDDLHHAFFDDEEAHGFGALGEDEGIGADAAVEHLLGDVFNFCLAEVVEDEMIFEAAKQEGHFLILLLLLLLLEVLFEGDIDEVIISFAVLSEMDCTYSSERV